ATPEGRARLAEDLFLTGVVLESLRTQQAARELLAGPGRQPASATPAPRFGGRAVWLTVVAASGLIAVGSFFFMQTPPSGPTAPEVFAQFEQVQGETFVVSKEEKQPAQAGQILVAGQGIATQGAESEAVVQMEHAVRLKLGGDTTVFTTEEP